MRVITDYEVAFSANPAELAKLVKDGIAKGYEPHGSLVLSSNGTLIQPMVKYETKY